MGVSVLFRGDHRVRVDSSQSRTWSRNFEKKTDPELQLNFQFLQEPDDSFKFKFSLTGLLAN